MKPPFRAPLCGAIAIVGNGQVDPSHYRRIERANLVIRFNDPSVVLQEESAKTDILVISNSSKQTKKLLSSQAYLNGQAFSRAKSIILPYHPSIIAKYMPKPNPLSYLRGTRADQTKLCLQTCQQGNKDCIIFDSESYFSACKVLGIGKDKMRKCFPSSGLMLIHELANQLDQSMHLDIYGFSFKGWKGHDWTSERAYVNTIISNGQVDLWL
jgi:hypothetical protein